MVEDVEIAWAAGLFEGEGCITICNVKDRHHRLPLLRLQVQMTDSDVVERFARIVACGSVSPELRFGRPHHKPTYRWLVSSRAECERLLLMFLPYFGERRLRRAHEMLEEIRRLDRECLHCGETFRAYRSDQHFCGSPHRSQWHRDQAAVAA